MPNIEIVHLLKTLDSSGVKRRQLLPVIWLLILTCILGETSRSAAPALEQFPEKLLEGESEFNLAVFIQGDLRGHVGPCCPANPMGGFARRMSYWNAFEKKYRGRPVLRLDGGSIFEVGLAEAHVINRWMLEGTYRSQLDALNLSAWDIPVWQELSRLASADGELKDLLNLPLVSANVTARIARFPSVQRHIIKSFPLDPQSGRQIRIGITGLLFDPQERIPRSSFQIEEPFAAAGRVIRELIDRSDYRIVLTDMDLGRAISLAVQVPKIDLMVVTHNYTAVAQAEQVGQTIIVMPANLGRMLSEVRLQFLPELEKIDSQTRLVPLDDTVPDDPALAQLIRRAQFELDEFNKTK